MIFFNPVIEHVRGGNLTSGEHLHADQLTEEEIDKNKDTIVCGTT